MPTRQLQALAGATQDEVRRHNLSNVLTLLHREGPASRSDLVARTGLNRSTVGALTAELSRLGLVTEGGGPSAGVGRPSILVAPASRGAYVLAIDLRVDRVIAALVGLGGEVLVRRQYTRPEDADDPDVAEILVAVARIARVVLRKAPAGSRCVGIGIGVPGLVSQPDGVVRAAPNLGWVDVGLGERVGAALGRCVPVGVGNDADLGVIAEHVRGVARNLSDVIYLGGQVGVGGGVLLDGQLLGGAGGFAGEVGHMLVNPNGRMCRCGNRGCWETEIGQEAILAAAARSRVSGDVHQVVDAARRGDRRAQFALDEVGTWLGAGTAALVNIFNPAMVIFGGELREVFPLVEETVRRRVDRALAAPRSVVELTVPGLADYSTLLGAAERGFEPLLADPLRLLAGVP